MRILPIVKITIFFVNAISTSMKYSKISRMQNLDTIHMAPYGRIYLCNFCLVSTQCIKYILRIRMVMFIYLSCDLRLVTYRPVANRLVAGCCSFCCRVTCDLRLVASCMSQVVVRFDVVRFQSRLSF